MTRGQPDAEVIRRHLQALEDALTHLRDRVAFVDSIDRWLQTSRTRPAQ